MAGLYQKSYLSMPCRAPLDAGRNVASQEIADIEPEQAEELFLRKWTTSWDAAYSKDRLLRAQLQYFRPLHSDIEGIACYPLRLNVLGL